jgi:hypothetical protein
MAQPIQEPTGDRELEGLSFRSRQLFRRPSSAQAGGMSLASFWTNTDQAIPTATPTFLDFDEAGGVWSSTNNFATFGNDVGGFNPGITTTDKFYTYVVGNSLIEVGYAVIWETGNYPKRTQLVAENPGGASSPSAMFAAGFYDGGGISGAAALWPTAPALLTQDPFDTTQDTLHSQSDKWWASLPDAYWQIVVTHSAGSDRNVVFAQITLIHLGNFD